MLHLSSPQVGDNLPPNRVLDLVYLVQPVHTRINLPQMSS